MKEWKNREVSARRAEILAHAEKIFAAKGFHKATMAEIASSAGFATGSLYQLFDNKEDLFATVILELTDAALERLTNAVGKQTTASAQITAFITELFSVTQKNTNLLTILMRGDVVVASRVSHRIRLDLIEKTERQIAIAEDILQRGVSDGEFMSGINCRITAMSLLGGVRFFAFYRIITNEEFVLTQEIIEDFLQTFMRGIR
ncbi:MAG: TetR/AcrR family transcriptional regulator [Deltaproteobacteria bacterium]|nr:TetR/AcrR family transcriptional regulator [Deltaproteobacteria bacterium]